MGRPKLEKPPCAVEGCERRSACKDLCMKHWLRRLKWERSPDRPAVLPEWDAVTVAWAAGLLEGEGYFRLKPTCFVRVNMTDEDVLRRLAGALGMGTITGPHAHVSTQRKPYWTWVVARRAHLKPLLLAVRPWLGKRRGSRVDAMLGDLRPSDNFYLYAAQHLASPHVGVTQ